MTLEEPIHVGTFNNAHKGIHTFHITVVGCGGTGSFLVRDLARLVSIINHDTERQVICSMSLCDGDVVEEKNIKRQNFIMADVGENKAVVLQGRYSDAYNLNMTAIPRYLETISELNSATLCASCNTAILVSCVDNLATRKLINTMYVEHNRSKRYSTRNFIWVDSGNEEWSGQVVLSCLACQDTYYKWLDKDNNLVLNMNTPTLFQMYPELFTKEDKFNSQLSCEERAISNPQNIMTNITAANIILQMLSNILFGSINYHQVTFNSKLGNSKTYYINTSMLKKYGLSAGLSFYNKINGSQSLKEQLSHTRESNLRTIKDQLRYYSYLKNGPTIERADTLNSLSVPYLYIPTYDNLVINPIDLVGQ